MADIGEATPTMRRALVARTDRLHRDLHVHPLIGRLAADRLDLQEYLAILRLFASVHMAAEGRRQAMDLWHGLSLKPEANALCADAADAAPDSAKVTMSWIEDAPQCLGMLYVLHGARFGRGVIGAHLRRSYPDYPRRFYSLPASPASWRLLLAELDHLDDGGRARDGMLAGALCTFALIAGLADRELERLHRIS